MMHLEIVRALSEIFLAVFPDMDVTKFASLIGRGDGKWEMMSTSGKLSAAE